ncbi:hypothetical protein COM86_12660 [Priestia megaterium]|uniref:hypothetical protein n=1 Tax=Priestia megaterium TaxID=1404 RepID=UPI000BEDD687|nr:hypothetical protein [Priestia megaterium]MED3972263.1 hypothetical protein [Priestia megaterium]PEB63304.1 hypothetical protein COM86_12660 [Priestia megaterium]
MRRVLGFLLVFAFAFGLMGSFSGGKAEAAFTESKTYTYNLEVKKSNSAVNKIHHEYMYDWVFPTSSGILITDAYYKFNSAGNIQLVTLTPNVKNVWWPSYLASSSGKVTSKKAGTTQVGYTTHLIKYNVAGVVRRQEPYRTDVTITKGAAVKGKKDTYKIKAVFKVTGKDDI